jgi:hypothetical protein
MRHAAGGVFFSKKKKKSRHRCRWKKRSLLASKGKLTCLPCMYSSHVSQHNHPIEIAWVLIICSRSPSILVPENAKSYPTKATKPAHSIWKSNALVIERGKSKTPRTRDDDARLLAVVFHLHFFFGLLTHRFTCKYVFLLSICRVSCHRIARPRDTS